MTPAQLLTLKTDILSRQLTDFVGMGPFDGTGDNPAIANWYNVLVTPTVQLWRSDITVREMRRVINWSDYAGLTPNGTQKQATYLALTQDPEGVDATDQGLRDALLAIFGNGSASLNGLLSIAMHPATRFQALFAGATVQGAKVSPFYGQSLTSDNVRLALQVV